MSRTVAALFLVLATGGCQLWGVSPDDARRIAAEDAAAMPRWRVDRVGTVREGVMAEVTDSPVVDTPPDRRVWVVVLFGSFGVACDANRCDLTGDRARITVDAGSGAVVHREVEGAR